MLQKKECRPASFCEIANRKTEIEEDNDPRAYCYNTFDSIDVCRPRSCPVIKIGIAKEDTKLDQPEKPGTPDKIKLIPFKKHKKTCVSWTGTGETEDGTEAASVTPPASGAGRDSVAVPKEKAKSKSEIDIDAKKAAEQLKLNDFEEEPVAVLASFADTKSARRDLMISGAVSLGGAFRCECCNCDPCECGPRGFDKDNLLAAVKDKIDRSEGLRKTISALGPGAMEILEDFILKKGMDAFRSEAFPETPSEKALREAWENGELSEMASCHCLPGKCPCPGDHYVYNKKQKKKRTGRMEKEGKKKYRKIRKKVKRLSDDGRLYEEWAWVTATDSDRDSKYSDTCVCPPTIHYLTPASSDILVSKPYVALDKKVYWDDFVVCEAPKIQRTVVIIKPESLMFREVVLRAIKNYGLDVINERRVHLSPEEASELYAKHYGSAHFPNLIVGISEAPIAVLSVAGINAVELWNQMIGPDGVLPSEWFFANWISRKFGYVEEIPNAIHGSKSPMYSEKENRYFFPDTIIDPVMRSEGEVDDYIGKYVNPTLLKGLAILAIMKPSDPIIFLAEWLVTHNPFQPHLPVNVCLVNT